MSLNVNCVVPGCDNLNKVRSNVLFHGFPRNSRLCKLWLAAMGYMPTDRQMMRKVCSDHFLKCDYKLARRPKGVQLKQFAVPSVFPQITVPPIQRGAAGRQPSETSKAAAILTDVAGNENARHETEGNSSTVDEKQTRNVTTSPVLVERTFLHPSRLHENYCLSGSIRWAKNAWKKASGENSQKDPLLLPKDQQSSEIIKATPRLNDVSGNKNGRNETEGSSSTAEGKEIPVMHIPSPLACREINAPLLVGETHFHPSRVHEDYCRSGSFRWAEGTWEKVNSENFKKGPSPPIQMGLRWQWLGMDIKGPLPQTQNGHKHLLTVMDFYSKWVEAYPMKSLTPREVALRIHRLICQLGFPHQIVSQMDRTFLREVNQALKTHLAVETCSLVVFRPDACTLDPLTQSYIESMVQELVKDHQRSWDVQLPVSLLSLRCRKHPSTRYSPFYMLYCREPCTDHSSRRQALLEDQLVDEEHTPTQSPSGAHGEGSEHSRPHAAEATSTLADVEEVLVVQCERCSAWAWVSQAQMRLGSVVYTCAACIEATQRGEDSPSQPDSALRQEGPPEDRLKKVVK